MLHSGWDLCFVSDGCFAASINYEPFGTKEMADVLEELDDRLDAYDMPQVMGVMISKVKAVWKKYVPVIGTVQKSWIGTIKTNETLKVKGDAAISS